MTSGAQTSAAECGLKLKAVDADDLTVISACMQDALMPRADMDFLKDDQRFVMVGARYRWESDVAGMGDAPEKSRSGERILTSLMIESVQQAQCRDLPANKQTPMVLLAITQDGDDSVVLTFAHGAEIRLTVASLSVKLADLCRPWTTKRCPEHRVADAAAEADAQLRAPEMAQS